MEIVEVVVVVVVLLEHLELELYHACKKVYISR
jgi:hypothetical protein